MRACRAVALIVAHHCGQVGGRLRTLAVPWDASRGDCRSSGRAGPDCEEESPARERPGHGVRSRVQDKAECRITGCRQPGNERGVGQDIKGSAIAGPMFSCSASNSDLETKLNEGNAESFGATVQVGLPFHLMPSEYVDRGEAVRAARDAWGFEPREFAAKVSTLVSEVYSGRQYGINTSCRAPWRPDFRHFKGCRLPIRRV